MSRLTMTVLALVWTGALIFLAVFTANGSGKRDPKEDAQTAGGRVGSYIINATDQVQLTGSCQWPTGDGALPLALQGSFPEGTCPLLVDESTVAAKGTWAPWTHRPVCTQAKRDEWGDVQQYCVFTDITFRGGRGISVIASPHVAAAMADTLDDSGVPLRLRDHPSTLLAGDPDREHGTAEEGNSFAVQQIPGRGKGVVATRRIRKGELVFVDYPIVLTQNTFTAPGTADDPADPHQILQLLQVAVQHLTPGQQKRVYSLAHSLGGERIRDIIRTNVFGGIEIDGNTHIGLFPLGSRINHNCQANTYWRYTPGYLSQEVIAMRDIELGEEVTHSYIPLGVVYEERQEQIGAWGFKCTCPLCSATPDQRQLSDQRRRRLYAIHEELGATAEFLAVGTSAVDRAKRMGELVDEMLFLVEKEQMWPVLCDYYVVVTRAHLDIDDVAGARRYWREAEAAWATYGGEQHESVDLMRALGREIAAREAAISRQ